MTKDEDILSVERGEALVDALLRSGSYPHAVTRLERLETHISWVVLTGAVAYKIKKPVKLRFLDFSTLERRRHYCEEELRLNRRWAPELYLDVVPIGGSLQTPVVGSDGRAMEYAVKMLQFPQEARLDQQLRAGRLTVPDMQALAGMVAAQHRRAPVARIEMVESGAIRDAMLENFDYLSGRISERQYATLRSWTEQRLAEVHDVLLERQRNGCIRECHGDLHLGNLVRLESGISAFDCVEFSEELRSIDVLSDTAFLFMDLLDHDREDLAYAFLNRYLECSGDYDGMTVFGLYLVYHCMIRAKVLAVRSSERERDDARQSDLEALAAYCNLASDWIARRAAWLVVMHGYSASGKTRLSAGMMTALPAIRLRSDIERKRLHGLREREGSGSAVGRGLYSGAASRRTYDRLVAVAGRLLRCGDNVILDAAFLDAAERRRARELAAETGAGFRIVDVAAPVETLRERLRARSASGEDASEADLRVLEHQMAQAEPLDAEEEGVTLHVDATQPDAASTALREL